MGHHQHDQRSFARLAVAAVATVACLAPAAAVAAPGSDSAATGTSAAAARHHVEFFQLGYRPGIVEPAKIFLTADSGPYLKRLHWSGWGRARTTAHGRLDNSCASCGGQRQAPAVVHLTHPVRCGGSKVYAYTQGYAVATEHDGSRKRYTVYTGCPAPRS